MKRSLSTSSFTQKQLFPISGKVISTRIIHGQGFSGDYVEYKIKILTYYKKWYINKRYSDFEILHSFLTSKLQNPPVLPPKRLFKTSDEVIEERRKMFNKYFKDLFTKSNILKYEEILNFIQIEKEVLELIMKKHSMMIKDSNDLTYTSICASFKKMTSSLKSKNNSPNICKSLEHNTFTNKFSSQEKDNYYASFLDFKLLDELNTDNNNEDEIIQRAGDLVIGEFLVNLSQRQENKSEIINTFESFLKRKRKWPCFSRAEIIKLFVGEKTTLSEISLNNQSNNSLASDDNQLHPKQKVIKGLMAHVGEIEKNIMGAQRCLQFLTKLIDYEFNPECNLYREVLKTRKTENFFSMKLTEHIKSNHEPSVQNALKILKFLIDEKLHFNYLKSILIDDYVKTKLEQWIKKF